MDGVMDLLAKRRAGTNRSRLALMALVLGLGFLPQIAEATPIRRPPILASQARAQAVEWRQANDFYARALRNRWATAPRIPQMRLLRATAEGLLPEVPMVQYLRWRRGLNPAQFDRNHPNIAAMLVRDAAVRPTVSVAQIPGPRPSDTIPPDRVGIPSAQSAAIPEPSSLLLGLTLMGAGALWARSARRRVGVPT
jgi:hypothetical protein